MASRNNEGASTSSSTRRWKYAVSLSFRGEDTREGFTSHLYKALCDKGINTFIDDKLPRGEEISEELIQAIKNSSILVIVFSENYAESKWCLDELAEIVECREKDREVQIHPVFYNVDPSEIRNQKGNFGIALANHEKRFKNNKDKVQRWRDALIKAANASGWHYKKGFSMHDLIQQMGKEVVRQQAPDILRKRSRLCCYEDSLKVLTTNKEPQLKNLINVNLIGCKFITEFPELWAPNLENLNLSFCENIVKLPKLWAPNLENLHLLFCKNLVEIDECFGSLEKLKRWDLLFCEKLQILPSQLGLKSLDSFVLSECSRLEKLPNFHPEMECLKTLFLYGSGIREVPSSIEHLTKLEKLSLFECKNLRDLPDSIYKLQQLRELETTIAKLRLTCNSFDSSSEYGFVKMKELYFRGYKSIIELDLLMKPDYFPALESIDLSYTNIVTIPESISRFPRLESLYIMNCKLLREIQGLPQSIMFVDAENCMLLDTQSPSGLLNQVIEITGILPSRVCGPQLTNYFPSETESKSETEGVEYEDWDVRHTIYFWGSEMPKWFNHQSVDNSIFFFVGRKFPKLAVCIVPGRGVASVSVHISINGYKISDLYFLDLFRFIRTVPNAFDQFEFFLEENNLFLFSLTQRSLQRHLNNQIQLTRILLRFQLHIARMGIL